MLRLVSVSFLFVFSLTLHGESPSPYAGQEARDIKAMSSGEVRDLLEGKGMGLALAAELNGYPGPLHVLELAEALELAESQIDETRALFEGMQSQARGVGRALVAAEKKLDEAFSEQTVNPESLRQQVSEIAELQGQLRLIHLETHLKQMELLSPEQIAAYPGLRGYDNGDGHHHHDPGHHRHHHDHH